MSDYLAGLATRVLAPREVIQPRIPSRFEPEIEGMAAAGDYVPPVPLPRAEAPASATAPVTAARPAPFIDTLRKAPPAAPHAPPPPEAAGERGTEPDRRPPETVEVSPAAHQRVLPRLQPPVATTERQVVTETIQAPPAAAHEAAQPRPPLPPLTRTVVRERRLPPRVLERLRLRREEAVVEHSAAPVPVEITIGRVEVRAVVAAPPAAPKAKPQPRIMSLEEYAAKRDGRSR